MDAVLAQAGDKLDVVSGHIYASFPMDDPNAGVTSDSFFNKLDAHRLVQVGGVTIYEGPLSFREVMLARGATQPFWLTETGLEATYGDATAEAKQATYYRHVLDAMATRAWWSATIFYESFDEPPAPYHFGVALHDDTAPGGYRPKAAFAVLQQGLPDAGVADLSSDLPVSGDLAVSGDLSVGGNDLSAEVPDLATAPARPRTQAASGCDVTGGTVMALWPLLLLCAWRRIRTIRG
jgi:hypothetical protein